MNTNMLCLAYGVLFICLTTNRDVLFVSTIYFSKSVHNVGVV